MTSKLRGLVNGGGRAERETETGELQEEQTRGAQRQKNKTSCG